MTVEFCPRKLARDAKSAAVGIALFILVCIVAQGCKLFQSKEAGELIEHAYAIELMNCAATAGLPGPYDEAADKKCRAEVDCRYGVGPC
jgi:hypothetical protein